MSNSKAEILREYGPFDGVDGVHGVTYDGENVWFCSGGAINAFDPESGKTVRSIPVASNAGTAFDGKHLYQIAARQIHKIDPETGRVLHTIPAPGNGNDSGMAWAEGRCGSESIGRARFVRSIRRPARFCARSSPIASSPASPG